MPNSIVLQNITTKKYVHVIGHNIPEGGDVEMVDTAEEATAFPGKEYADYAWKKFHQFIDNSAMIAFKTVAFQLKATIILTSDEDIEVREIQQIRDIKGHIKGRLYEEGDDQVLRNATGQIVGRYVKSANATRDHSGRNIGYGNQIMTLLPG